MKSYLLTALLWVTLLGQAFAQSDSLRVIEADWQKQKIAPGVTLKTYWFSDNSLFGANQNVSILEIKPKKKLMLDLGYDPKKLIPTSDFGKTANALAALNGTFFDMTNGGSTQFLKSDGVIINETRIPKSGIRENRQNAALVINEGRVSIEQLSEESSWEKSLLGEDIMVSGPMLVIDGHQARMDSSSFNLTRHPRSVVALTKKNRVLLITVDGRSANAAGMSTFELSKLARWLNSEEAMNLDGGGSTALWVAEKGVVNYPSDNKKWDHQGERKVANVVLLKRK